MFTKTTDKQKDEAPIQAPALNSTIWGGLAAAVAAIGAATIGVFSAMNTSEWEVRVAIVGGVTFVIAAGVLALVALIRHDAQTRLTASTGKNAAVAKPAEAEQGVVWITPPPMHVFSNANPETKLQVILVGVSKDKVSYYAAEDHRSPVILPAEQVHHVEIGEHSFNP